MSLIKEKYNYSDRKRILNKSKEGEEWIGGPFACIYAIQYFKDTLMNEDGLDKSKYDDSKKSYKAFPTKNIEKLLPWIEWGYNEIKIKYE